MLLGAARHIVGCRCQFPRVVGDLVGFVDDLGEGPRKTADRRIEVLLETGEFCGQGTIDARGKITLRHPVERAVEERQNVILLFPHALLLCFYLRTFVGKHVEIDGDRVIHVQHRGLDRCTDTFDNLLAFFLDEEALQFRFDDGLDDAFQHKGVAADIPARLKPQSRMGAPDGTHRLGIISVENAG